MAQPLNETISKAGKPLKNRLCNSWDCLKNPEFLLLLVICSKPYLHKCILCYKTDATINQQILKQACVKRKRRASGWLLPRLLWKWWVVMKQWISRRRDGFQAAVVFSVLFDANSVAKTKFVFGTWRYTHEEHLASHERIRKFAFRPECEQH